MPENLAFASDCALFYTSPDGAELVESTVINASQNAEANGISNVEFILGYQPKDASAVDMFPRRAHVETTVLMAMVEKQG